MELFLSSLACLAVCLSVSVSVIPIDLQAGTWPWGDLRSSRRRCGTTTPNWRPTATPTPAVSRPSRAGSAGGRSTLSTSTPCRRSQSPSPKTLTSTSPSSSLVHSSYSARQNSGVRGCSRADRGTGGAGSTSNPTILTDRLHVITKPNSSPSNWIRYSRRKFSPTSRHRKGSHEPDELHQMRILQRLLRRGPGDVAVSRKGHQRPQGLPPRRQKRVGPTETL